MKALVVGAGMTGIAAATSLSSLGIRTVVLEAADGIGGRMGIATHGDSRIELGGRNIKQDAALDELFATYGITEFDDYKVNSVLLGTRTAFDVRQTGGSLAALLRLIGNVYRVGPLPLLRVWAAARPARTREDGWLIGSPPWVALAERTADASLVHYFGRAVADGLFRPWTVRTMASEPEEVYVGNIAPLLGRKARVLKRVRVGLAAFVDAAAQRLEIRCGHSVESLLTSSMNVVGVEGVTSDGGRFSDKADFVVVATPASIAARIVETAAPELSCALRRIVYRPVATVVATYASATFPGSAGGLFLPRGATASHISKQGSKGTTLRYSFAGVAARKLLASRSSLETLLDEGEHTFKEVGGRIGERLRHTGRIWLEGHCAQSWMHHQTMKSIMTHVGQVRGLAVAGDYFQSNSLEGCALSARRSVAEALSRMKT